MEIPLVQAREAGLLVELSESTCIRWIEEIAGVNPDETAQRLREITRRVRELRNRPRSRDAAEERKVLLQERLRLQYLPEYVCLVCRSKTDFYRAIQGFQIHGMRYFRLTGTSNGLKKSAVVFAAEYARNGAPLLEELRRRIDNGRDLSRAWIPAKLEAYRSLICSATAPLSDPGGVLVVDDCITHFPADYIRLSDALDPESGPQMEEIHGGVLELDESDGYGLMSPALAERWGADLKLDYLPAGICLRNAFTKGMAFTFDFHAFAREAGQVSVRDAWGQKRDIRKVDLVLTTSMLKLWDSYPSLEAYLENCTRNRYRWGAAKVTPKSLDQERTANYQFLQSFFLSDQELWELVSPTLFAVSDAMGGDYAKTLLFLRGADVDEKSAVPKKLDWVAALSADRRLMKDPFIRQKIKNLIKKKINGAKIGEINLHGNFSVVSGDPYALCQHMFGLPVTGLLKAGEIYNRYWADIGVSEVACFRAPMSSMHNVLKKRIAAGPDLSRWYQYLNVCTLFNAWDTSAQELNGMDKDGDLVFLTDCPILVRHVRQTLPLICEQKKGVKVVPDEKALAQSNAAGFGDGIGKITNRITAMTELQAMFPPGSEAFQRLEYRIQAGQKLQQDEIDRIKGIVSNPMPKSWYSRKAVEKAGDEIDRVIVADRKPYFMIYRYEDEYQRYRSYLDRTQARALVFFGRSLEEIRNAKTRTAAEQEFLDQADLACPVLRTGGLINRLCGMVEEFFQRKPLEQEDKEEPFDPAILKSGCGYSAAAYETMKAVYERYLDAAAHNEKRCRCYRLDEDETRRARAALIERFRDECAAACCNEREAADILVDLCYRNAKSKQFAWQMCGEVLAENVIRQAGGKLCYVTRSERGEIPYQGERFTVCKTDWRETPSEPSF